MENKNPVSFILEKEMRGIKKRYLPTEKDRCGKLY